jgi:hypothetical protein
VVANYLKFAPGEQAASHAERHVGAGELAGAHNRTFIETKQIAHSQSDNGHFHPQAHRNVEKAGQRVRRPAEARELRAGSCRVRSAPPAGELDCGSAAGVFGAELRAMFGVIFRAMLGAVAGAMLSAVPEIP